MSVPRLSHSTLLRSLVDESCSLWVLVSPAKRFQRRMQLVTLHHPFPELAFLPVLTQLHTFHTLVRYAMLTIHSVGMFVVEFITAIIGVTAAEGNDAAVKAQIALICIYIFWFASTWGPGAWVVIGEIFPIPIRSRGVGLSTASNWSVHDHADSHW